MNTKKFSEALGEIDDRYINEAITYEPQAASPRLKRRLPAALVAAIIAVFLMGAGVVAVMYGDLWLESPSDDPVEVVRSALENQAEKEYAVKIEIERIEIDEEETARVVERFITGTIADWRGWSDEYLAEHFVVVKALYYAEYDHTQTTRSDGDIEMYFYLTQDVNSGEWTIVDNSGNVNWSETNATEVESSPAVGSTEEQIFSYLSDLCNDVYTPYYDGLHYKISDYSEVLDNGKVTATFLWTYYFLGKGWDVETDEGVEQEANLFLQATAMLKEDGSLDLETISILADNSVVGPPNYVIPIENFFPTQLAD
ncbi:MAG: hypothetical protein Q4B96_04190 [Bacillota bacterium]|nr:hypothetical protein [Bacillota bacterium]